VRTCGSASFEELTLPGFAPTDFSSSLNDPLDIVASSDLDGSEHPLIAVIQTSIEDHTQSLKLTRAPKIVSNSTLNILREH